MGINGPPGITGTDRIIGSAIPHPFGYSPERQFPYSFTDFLSESALSVRSQVKSGSLRPKCPYAAVFA